MGYKGAIWGGIALVATVFSTAGFGDVQPLAKSQPGGNRSLFPLGRLTSLAPGTKLNIRFVGKDTTGASYVGSYQSTVAGVTTYQGRGVIEKDSKLEIIKAGQGVVLARSHRSYYNPNATLFKQIHSDGAVAVPANVFQLPSSVPSGRFPGQVLSYSNGINLTQVWKVMDAGKGSARIVVKSTAGPDRREVDTYSIATNGSILSVKKELYNFPSKGVTTTLNGVANLDFEIKPYM